MNGQARERFLRQRRAITVEMPARLSTMVGTRSAAWDIPEDDVLILFALSGAEINAGLAGNEYLQARLRREMETIIVMHGYAVSQLLTVEQFTRG